MNQEKIGKFIQKKRKEKKITQSELAEKLGVSDRTVGNWENGRNMPDLSLFKPLCDCLDISINDLLSGEEIKKENYQDKFEENIVNTIDYSNKKINKYSNVVGILLTIFGLFITMTSIMIFPSESSWSSFYSVVGMMLFVVGISKLTNKMKYSRKLLLILVIFIGTIGIMYFLDYVNVKNNHVAPRFRGDTTYLESVIIYETPLYDVIRCERDSLHETYNIEKHHLINKDNAYTYCHDIKIKRFRKIINDNYENITSIRISKIVDYNSNGPYATTYQNGNYQIVKDIDDKTSIREIMNVLKKANYPEFHNDMLYTYLFQLYVKNNVVLEFDLGMICTHNDSLAIFFTESDKDILNSFIK